MSLLFIAINEIGFVREREQMVKNFFIGVGSVLLGIVVGIISICCMVLGIEYWNDLYQFKNWVNKNIFNK